MAALQSASEAYHVKVVQWKNYQAALRSYAALLEKTEVSLDRVVTAASRPSLSREELYQLVAIAGEVRTYALQIKDILRG